MNSISERWVTKILNSRWGYILLSEMEKVVEWLLVEWFRDAFDWELERFILWLNYPKEWSIPRSETKVFWVRNSIFKSSEENIVKKWTRNVSRWTRKLHQGWNIESWLKMLWLANLDLILRGITGEDFSRVILDDDYFANIFLLVVWPERFIQIEESEKKQEYLLGLWGLLN